MATKQTIIASLASILLLASCSQEEILNNESTAPRKAIGFNVTADRVTRAQNIFTSTNLPSQFVVSAWYHTGDVNDGSVYFDQDLVSKDGSSASYSNTRGLRYWPTQDNEKLNFYAYAGDEDASFSLTNLDGTALEPTLSGIELDTDAKNHKDIIYASVHNEARDRNASGAVSLTFNHAMSQISVAAKNTNPNIHIVVNEVAIGGLAQSGTFHFDASAGDTPGWTVDNSTKIEVASTLGSEVTVGATATALTASDAENFMVIPSNYAKADASAFNAATATGAYLRIKCTIWNVAGDAYKEGDVEIHNGDLYIPCDLDLALGKKYTYTVNFGQGTGGVDANGVKSLVALDISNVTVSGWETADAPDDLEE